MSENPERPQTVESKEEGEVVVEIGSGSEPLPLQLTERSASRLLSRTSRYINVDINESALERSRARGEDKSLYDFVVAQADKLPFADASVHRIVMTNFLGIPPLKKLDRKYYHEHLLEECHRVLRDGGELVVAEVYTPHYAREWLERHKTEVSALFVSLGEAPLSSVFELRNPRPIFAKSYTDAFVLVLKRKPGVSSE